jgi:hypothetical protein
MSHQIVKVDDKVVESFLGRIKGAKNVRYDDSFYLNESELDLENPNTIFLGFLVLQKECVVN